MKKKIEEGDYIRCTYEDDAYLYGEVLWVSPNQTIITVDSNGTFTVINVNASNLDLIEIAEEHG